MKWPFPPATIPGTSKTTKGVIPATMQVEDLKSAFRARFQGTGEPRVCRAPGRVNLLGEHVDYNGLSVLPMTLSQGIYIAFAVREDNVIRLESLDPKYPSAGFENEPEIAPSEAGSWENYCKAAVSGLNNALDLDGTLGMDLLVWGDIPTAAGLSSSSALVVATALAYLAASGTSTETDLTRLRLAEILAQAERYVGTQGGGMDQAIILLGGENHGCKIDFNPLRVEEVPLFGDHVFVICNSLVEAQKTGAARQRYNEGPLSCRLIRAMVERQAQQTFGHDVKIASLGDLWFGPLCLLDREVEDLLDETFPQPRTTLADASRFLGLSEAEIRSQWLGDLPEPDGGFPLQARARHQRTEYQRVEAGRDALVAGDADSFGALMDASHESCAHDYRVSCPELDRMVSLAREGESIGSRLTGAGFGGCTIHLVPVPAVSQFTERMNCEYYTRLVRAKRAETGTFPTQFVAVAGGAAGCI